MAREADYYSAHEAACLLGLSPARVRQMLRSGELGGERGPGSVEGVPGPWRVPAGAVDAYRRDARRVGPETPDAAETVALPRGVLAPGAAGEGPGRPPEERAEDTPSETSERLSEGVGALREAARREKERADGLQAELDAERSGGRSGRGAGWRGR